MSHESIVFNCLSCNNSIEIDKRWTSGGVNDCGGNILISTGCEHFFAFHLGRDVNDSHVVLGAEQIDQYDDDVENKNEVLKSTDWTNNSSSRCA